VYHAGAQISPGFSYSIYVDDALPAGATQVDALDGWNWVSVDPPPYSGKYSHLAPVIAGTHYHQFTNATQVLSVVANDNLYFWIYLDPNNPPSEVMIQFQLTNGDAEHRAYWGTNSIAFGTDGTNSRRGMGALPTPGKWSFLSVPATQVG